MLPISDDCSEEEYWEIFTQVLQAIPKGKVVLLDVTHGFRSLPLLTVLILTCLRTVRKVTLQHVLYGAFEA